jgi:hypothetical protein
MNGMRARIKLSRIGKGDQGQARLNPKGTSSVEKN